MAENQITKLVIWGYDGTTVAYELSEKPRVTFSPTSLIITTNNVQVTYKLSLVKHFTFENNSASKIKNLLSEENPFELKGDKLLFPSLKAGNIISLYNQSGMLIFQKNISENGEYAFPIVNLSTGVYIVKLDNLTYKFLKK